MNQAPRPDTDPLDPILVLLFLLAAGSMVVDLARGAMLTP